MNSIASKEHSLKKLIIQIIFLNINPLILSTRIYSYPSIFQPSTLFNLHLSTLIIIASSNPIIDFFVVNCLLGPFIFTIVNSKNGPTITTVLHTAQTHVLSLWQLLFQSDHNARYSVNSKTIGINLFGKPRQRFHVAILSVLSIEFIVLAV